MELNDVNKAKLEELNEMSVTDEGFKDAANAMSNLIETQAKIEQQEKDHKLKVKDTVCKIALGVTAAITPFVLKALDFRHDDEQLDKVLEYEKTGCVMSQGGKHTLSNLFRH